MYEKKEGNKGRGNATRPLGKKETNIAGEGSTWAIRKNTGSYLKTLVLQVRLGSGAERQGEAERNERSCARRNQEVGWESSEQGKAQTGRTPYSSNDAGKLVGRRGGRRGGLSPRDKEKTIAN